MATVLFVDACVRGQKSRTKILCEKLLEKFRTNQNAAFEIVEIPLSESKLLPLSDARLKTRDALLSAGKSDDGEFRFANAFARADAIVIGAPYWDMSFPAVLKIFLEDVCVAGLTFSYAADGKPVGLCKAKNLYYVTTSGGFIGELNFGFDYVASLCKLFGIENAHFVSAQGLDIDGADVQKILSEVKLPEV